MNSAQRCKAYRRRILEVSQQVTALHIAPAFSCLEALDVIYESFLGPKDTCILSKGHGAMAQYVILEARGYFLRAELNAYCTPAGTLGTHPDRGTPGIAASTGSLGHGLGIAVGMAYAARAQQTDGQVYCVISDGELQEGSTWEAIALASNLGLGNLRVICDSNGFGGLEAMRNFNSFYPIAPKISAFGWCARQVKDGHSHGELFSALHNETTYRGQPLMVVANTIKGKGVSFMENVPIWHYRSPNSEEYARALEELE